MSASKEVITVVDEKNNEVASATRAEMREKNLIHRATYILVFNSKDELFVQKRTATKDIYPGFYEIAAGGVVLAGESYELSAKRELEEELGIKSTSLTHLFDNFYDDPHNRVWGRVFSCVHDGPMQLQPEEVESGEFVNLAEVEEMMSRHPFCPDGIEVLKRVMSLR